MNSLNTEGRPNVVTTDDIDQDATIALLDLDHESLVEAIARRPRCHLESGDVRPAVCPHRADCRAAIRKTLYALIYYTVAHFDRETEALRLAVCREDFEAHGFEHVHLTETLTEILGRFTETSDCMTAIRDIAEFGCAIREHMINTDAPMLHTRSPAGEGS